MFLYYWDYWIVAIFDKSNIGNDFKLKLRFHLYLLLESISMRTWMCLICGWVYDEEAGLPEEGIAPGTKWEDVPPNWVCPECGARKEDFEMMEI